MLYRKFPKSDDELSILGFGCMRFPVINDDSTKIDKELSTKMLRYAIDEGLNYIDTAYPYHGKGMSVAGQSEPFVGKVLRDGYREKVKLATKLPSWLVYSHKDMDKIFSQQLQRLETAYIDYYLVHGLNKTLWDKMKSYGVIEFLEKLLNEGKIRYAGFSFHDDSVDLFKEIVDVFDWTFCQIQYNYLDENYQAGKEGMLYAVQKLLGIIVMEPLRGGNLTNDISDVARDTFNRVNESWTPAEWALRWLWNHDEVSVVLSGMSTLEQVIENVKIAKNAKANSMTDKEIGCVNQVKIILEKNAKVGCTTCRYCMPCPTGVNIPQNFTYYNDFFRATNQEQKTDIKKMYFTLLSDEEKAGACIECGQCEEHCPQGIPIIEKLKEVSEMML